MNEEQARKHIEELKGYYAHLAAFVGVNLFLFMINMVTSPSAIWFIYPLFGWGIGLIIHTVTVYGSGHDWEQRKLQELTGLNDTREELERLSERTDSLITILSSVDWEKIDPELVQTQKNLKKAQADIEALKKGESAENQAKVKEEIEKLEAFVTSSKFDYYEMAADGGKNNH